MAAGHKCWIAGGVLLGLPLGACAAATKLPPDARWSLERGEFRALSRVRALPAGVGAEFARSTHEPRFQMADPGQPFQATDVVTTKGLPWRRLVFGGLTKAYCVVHYEKGGIGHSYHVVLFRLANGKARFVWGALATHKIPGLTGLLKAVERNELDDSARYYW